MAPQRQRRTRVLFQTQSIEAPAQRPVRLPVVVRANAHGAGNVWQRPCYALRVAHAPPVGRRRCRGTNAGQPQPRAAAAAPSRVNRHIVCLWQSAATIAAPPRTASQCRVQAAHGRCLRTARSRCRLRRLGASATLLSVTTAATSSLLACRLTPRCSGRHPGDLSNVLASGVRRPWLRSAARPGVAAELIVR